MTAIGEREERGLSTILIRASLVGVVLAATFGLLPEKVAAQESVQVAGTVIDDGTGAPIDGATVRLADSSGSVRETITGPGGAFAFAQVVPGEHTLVVRRLGYEVLSTPLEIEPGAPPRLDVRLQPQAIPLEPLEVGVEGRPPRLVESGFYDRKEEGWGVFFEPEWIEANNRGFVRLADFMSKSPDARSPVTVREDPGIPRPEAGRKDGRLGNEHIPFPESGRNFPFSGRAASDTVRGTLGDRPRRCGVVPTRHQDPVLRLERGHHDLRGDRSVVQLDGSDGGDPEDRGRALRTRRAPGRSRGGRGCGRRSDRSQAARRACVRVLCESRGSQRTRARRAGGSHGLARTVPAVRCSGRPTPWN